MSERHSLPGAPWLWALTAALVVLVLGAALLWLPWLRQSRPFVAATPAPAPTSPLAYTPVALRPGARLCMAPVTLPADGRVVQLLATTGLAREPRLTATLSADGYRASAPLSDRSTGQALQFDVEPPPRDLADGRVCVRNDGAAAVALVGSTEVFTAGARPDATIDGRAVPAKVALSLYTGESRGIVHRAGAALDHAAAFKPFGPVLLGLVGLLLLVGLPLATIGGLVRTLRAEPPEPPERS